MGLRGPGAKPLKLVSADASAEQPSLFAPLPPAPSVLPWEAAGLSRAARVIAFIESLTITAGKLAGSPFRLRGWQRDFIEAVYRIDADGGRPVRTALLSMGRKNGKSQLAAALALAHLAGPEAEPRGQVFSAANDREQAALIFAEMVAMTERMPFLAERLSVKAFHKEILNVRDGSIYRALSSDAGTKHGLSPSFCVVDELGQAPNRDLYDALDTAMGARAEPLMVVISTQAANDLAPLSQLIDYGLQVNAGTQVDPSFHMTLYAADPEADPWSEAAWQAANPALGDFRSIEDVRRQANQARRMPAKEPAFRNLVLNQRVAAEAQFLTASLWGLNGAPVDLERLRGRECYAGLDLSAVRDLTALVLAFPAEDGTLDVVPFFWLPGDGLREREDEDRVPYWAWAKAGHLLTTPGVTIDPAFVAAKVAEIASSHDLRVIGFDRWRIDDFKRALAETGADVALQPVGQGFKDFAPAVDVLERTVAERRLRHGNHPVLTWCAGNAVVTPDPAGNRKLDKSRSRGRIDGLVALAMALLMASRRSGEKDWMPMMDLI